jgi:hypothetical protein
LIGESIHYASTSLTEVDEFDAIEESDDVIDILVAVLDVVLYVVERICLKSRRRLTLSPSAGRKITRKP